MIIPLFPPFWTRDPPGCLHTLDSGPVIQNILAELCDPLSWNSFSVASHVFRASQATKEPLTKEPLFFLSTLGWTLICYRVSRLFDLGRTAECLHVCIHKGREHAQRKQCAHYDCKTSAANHRRHCSKTHFGGHFGGNVVGSKFWWCRVGGITWNKLLFHVSLATEQMVVLPPIHWKSHLLTLYIGYNNSESESKQGHLDQSQGGSVARLRRR